MSSMNLSSSSSTTDNLATSTSNTLLSTVLNEQILPYILQILDNKHYSIESCTLLSGGYLNFVWRIKLKYQQTNTDTDNVNKNDDVNNKKSTIINNDPMITINPLLLSLSLSSIIVKYHPPYIATKPDIPFDIQRSIIEGYVMSLVNKLFLSSYINKNNVLQIPQIYSTNTIIPCLIMEDGGTLSTLEEWLLSLLSSILSNTIPSNTIMNHVLSEYQSLGKKIGNTIGKLHGLSYITYYKSTMTSSTENINTTLLTKDIIYKYINNQSIQVMRQTLQYNNVVNIYSNVQQEILKQNPSLLLLSEERLSFLRSQCKYIGEWFSKDTLGFVLIHGDLWLRSILLSSSSTSNSSNSTPTPWLIDWELTHWGNPAQDISHLAAHLWMIKELCLIQTYIQIIKFDPCLLPSSLLINLPTMDEHPKYISHESSESSNPFTKLFSKLDFYMQSMYLDHPMYQLLDDTILTSTKPLYSSKIMSILQNTKILIDSINNLWSHCLEAYRSTINQLFTNNSTEFTEQFLVQWSIHQVEKFSCVHMGCEVASRLGTFLEGGVYDPNICKLDKTSSLYQYYLYRALYYGILVITEESSSS